MSVQSMDQPSLEPLNRIVGARLQPGVPKSIDDLLARLEKVFTPSELDFLIDHLLQKRVKENATTDDPETMRVRVAVSDRWRFFTIDVSGDAGTHIANLISAIVNQFELPTTTPDNRLISYGLLMLGSSLSESRILPLHEALSVLGVEPECDMILFPMTSL